MSVYDIYTPVKEAKAGDVSKSSILEKANNLADTLYDMVLSLEFIEPRKRSTISVMVKSLVVSLVKDNIDQILAWKNNTSEVIISRDQYLVRTQESVMAFNVSNTVSSLIPKIICMIAESAIEEAQVESMYKVLFLVSSIVTFYAKEGTVVHLIASSFNETAKSFMDVLRIEANNNKEDAAEAGPSKKGKQPEGRASGVKKGRRLR
tara:strand:- start:11838 stop:12455 length:618 start_codon:yes stop_codon:yes gene_type:complete